MLKNDAGVASDWGRGRSLRERAARGLSSLAELGGLIQYSRLPVANATAAAESLAAPRRCTTASPASRLLASGPAALATTLPTFFSSLLAIALLIA